jgi:hypothetical protein
MQNHHVPCFLVVLITCSSINKVLIISTSRLYLVHTLAICVGYTLLLHSKILDGRKHGTVEGIHGHATLLLSHGLLHRHMVLPLLVFDLFYEILLSHYKKNYDIYMLPSIRL